MDTFCEQLVSIRKGAKFYLGTFGVWFAVVILTLISMATFSIIAPFVALGTGYAAYLICGFFSIEYEYIITNGTVDVDIIYSKRSRKRLYSFELTDVESIEKYNGEQLDKNRYKNITVACDPKRDEAYKFVIAGESSVSVAVIAPNERTRQEVIKFVPKFVGNKAFK